jgi:TRAP-type C4-dicarboxylate transport system permease small subunit
MRLGEWPGFQGLRILLLWVVLVFVVFGWRYYWSLTRAVADETTSAPFSFTAPLLIAFGPLLIFAIVYGVWRRRRSGRP